MKHISLVLFCALLAVSCSGKGDRDLYESARSAYDRKDYTTAVRRYEDIVSHYPSSALAESSQYRIALIYNNDLRDMRAAVHSYKKFRTLFPQSPQASTALFLTGFLYNNELHMVDSAREAYELFLKIYPGDSLARSARFEISSLGLDPSHFIGLDSAASPAAGTRPR